jgi:uncharacterized membrane protein YcjF (UPF0283 family)
MNHHSSNNMKRNTVFVMSLLTSMAVNAQGEQAQGGFMRSDLKIYVVVAVLVLILLGIALFLFGLERRLSRLEKRTN